MLCEISPDTVATIPHIRIFFSGPWFLTVGGVEEEPAEIAKDSLPYPSTPVEHMQVFQTEYP